MANYPTASTLTIYSESSGMYLAVSPGVSQERDAWLIVTNGDRETTVEGPRQIGQWLKFCPSDWSEAFPPYPDPVQRILDRLPS